MVTNVAAELTALAHETNQAADRTPLDVSELQRLSRLWMLLLHQLGIGASPLTTVRAAGTTIHLKDETRLPIGAYKLRGATVNVASAQARGFSRVVTASTGNHGRGVSRACASLGMTGVVFAPTNTPATKIQAIEQDGSVTVKLEGHTFSDADAAAHEWAAENPECALVHPYDAVQTILGQSTIGCEIAAAFDGQHRGPLVLVPAGGGGLLAGVALALQAFAPGAKLIGVCSDAAPAMHHSFHTGTWLEVPVRPSFAGGVSVAKPGKLPFTLISRFVEDMVLVDDREIDHAVSFLHEAAGIRAEGAGAVATAALLSGKVRAAGRQVVSVVSGSNIGEVDHQAALLRASMASKLAHAEGVQLLSRSFDSWR